jgi:hypothetical protein
VSSSFQVAGSGAKLLVSEWDWHVQEQMVAFLRDYGSGNVN